MSFWILKKGKKNVKKTLRPQSHWSEWIKLQKLRIKLTERSIWTDFDCLRTIFLLTTFYVFWRVISKKRKVFLKSEKNVKYVFSNTGVWLYICLVLWCADGKSKSRISWWEFLPAWRDWAATNHTGSVPQPVITGEGRCFGARLQS